MNENKQSLAEECFDNFFGRAVFETDSTGKHYDNSGLKSDDILYGLGVAHTNTGLIKYLKRRMFMAFRESALCDIDKRDLSRGEITAYDKLLNDMKTAFTRHEKEIIKNKKE